MAPVILCFFRTRCGRLSASESCLVLSDDCVGYKDFHAAKRKAQTIFDKENNDRGRERRKLFPRNGKNRSTHIFMSVLSRNIHHLLGLNIIFTVMRNIMGGGFFCVTVLSRGKFTVVNCQAQCSDVYHGKSLEFCIPETMEPIMVITRSLLKTLKEVS